MTVYMFNLIANDTRHSKRKAIHYDAIYDGVNPSDFIYVTFNFKS